MVAVLGMIEAICCQLVPREGPGRRIGLRSKPLMYWFMIWGALLLLLVSTSLLFTCISTPAIGPIAPALRPLASSDPTSRRVHRGTAITGFSNSKGASMQIILTRLLKYVMRYLQTLGRLVEDLRFQTGVSSCFLDAAEM
jgi:hypothetical protein